MVVLGVLMQIKYKQIGKKEFELFYSTSINSKLKSIYAGTGGTRITLVDNRKFVFLPRINDSGFIFSNLANDRDLIIKKEYSDSLILVKNKEEFIFSFEKP